MKSTALAAFAIVCATASAAAQNFSADDLTRRTVHRRAVEAVIWGMPAVNFDLMVQAELKAGMKDNQVVFLENRGQAFGVWREPFTELRVPLLFNLRRDALERAQHNANVYNDWFLERVFVIVPLQAMAGKFLTSMKDYPPSQTPGSFNLEKIQKQIEAAARGG